MKLDNRIGKRKKFKYLDLNELENEQIKEDKIEKLIESFQIWVITISPKGGKHRKKENLFNAKNNPKQRYLFKRNSSNSRERTDYR